MRSRWRTRDGGARSSANPHLRNGLNIAFGKVTCKPVAEALRYKFVDPMAVLN